MHKFDTIIIGGGPGGYLASQRLAEAGQKVVLIEKEELGGTCLNVGCIPTKTLLTCVKHYVAAKKSEDRTATPQFGVNIKEVSFDWSAMQAWKQEVVSKLRAGLEAKEKKLAVHIVKGTANLIQPGLVKVENEEYAANSLILATGSMPSAPPLPGLQANPCVVDSTGLLAVKKLPKTLIIIGGGVIGIEFADLFSSLGVHVYVIEMLPEVLPCMDKEMAALLRRTLAKVIFYVGSRVQKLDGNKVYFTDSAGIENSIEGDIILIATGRVPCLSDLHTDAIQLDCSAHGISTDNRMKTNIPFIWAVGDVTGKSFLAHAAYRMAEVAAADILATTNSNRKIRNNLFRSLALPWVVYTLTEAAGVGLTETAAKAAGITIKKASLPLRISGRFCSENGFAGTGQVKIIADATNDRLLGIQIVGSPASEIIWGAATLLEMQMSVQEAKELIIPHPSIAEVIRDVLWEIQ